MKGRISDRKDVGVLFSESVVRFIEVDSESKAALGWTVMIPKLTDSMKLASSVESILGEDGQTFFWYKQ